MKLSIAVVAFCAFLVMLPPLSCAKDSPKDASTKSAEPNRHTEDCKPLEWTHTAELTVGECLRLGGNITVDASCPKTTTTQTDSGGTFTGTFKCRGKGQTADQGVCVNENEKE